MSKTVLMGLSGGVDSAACVRLLQNRGHEVSGLVIRFSPAHEGAVATARVAAQELGIPLHVADCTELFEREVIRPFCQSYAKGRTPNPCVVCNPLVKFHTLAQTADKLGIEAIATGHYAKTALVDGAYYVRRGACPSRDQSYMLYRLPQHILARLLLPAGEMAKDDIRSLASEAGLSSAGAPDSQEICFIPNGDYASYIEARGVAGKSGHFISPEGERLGPHSGVLHYTVGQRKGLGIALGRPVFVGCIRQDGDIELVYGEETLASAIRVEDVFPADASSLGNRRLEVKIRSMAVPVPCVTEAVDGRLRATFDVPQRSPAPGQHAVFYEGELVVGGGVIAEVFKTKSS